MAADRASEYLLRQHPLQRLSSPSRGTSALVHLLGLLGFAYSFKFLMDNPNHASAAYGWHFQFLTILGLLLATLTFGVALLADITRSRNLFLVKNILSVCSAPMETIITVLYWSIKAIDPALLLPPGMEQIPLTADLGFHLFPTLFMMADLLLLSPPWTITAVPAMALSHCIAFGYWFWVEKCYQNNGWYPYPLFELLDTKQRIGLFSTSATLMTISTLTLKWLHGRLNGFGRAEYPQARPGDVKKADYH